MAPGARDRHDMLVFCCHCYSRVQLEGPDPAGTSAPPCVRCKRPLWNGVLSPQAPRVLVRSPDQDDETMLLPPRLGIGRDPGNGLQLLDGQVSRRHASIFQAQEGIVVQDLGSRNGSTLNGEPIRGTRALNIGDRVDVGRTEIHFYRGETAPNPARRDGYQVPGVVPAAAERRPEPGRPPLGQSSGDGDSSLPFASKMVELVIPRRAPAAPAEAPPPPAPALASAFSEPFHASSVPVHSSPAQALPAHSAQAHSAQAHSAPVDGRSQSSWQPSHGAELPLQPPPPASEPPSHEPSSPPSITAQLSPSPHPPPAAPVRLVEGFGAASTGRAAAPPLTPPAIPAASSSPTLAQIPAPPRTFQDPLPSTTPAPPPETGAPAGSRETYCVAELDVSRDKPIQPAANLTTSRDIQREYGKLLSAFRMSEQLRAVTSLSEMMNRALELIFDLFPADRGVILLAEPSGELVPRAVRERDDARREGELRLSRTLLDRALTEKKAVLTHDAPRIIGTRSVIAAGIDSAMTVPLFSREHLVGILHVDTSSSRKVFSKEDLEILSGVASQIAGAVSDYRLHEQVQRESEARRRLGRYLSPGVVEQIVSQESTLDKGGELCRATILFCDIRSFTSIAETLTSQGIVDLLNEYFELMVDIVFHHGGTLDKFIGDALMALWGVPLTTGDDAGRAVQAALEMQSEIERLNIARKGRGEAAIHAGIGISTGEVIAGNIGSSRRMEYTVIGDEVNIASRLCGVARGGEIIVSEATRRELGGRLKAEPYPVTHLKGKTGEVTLHKVVGLLDPQTGTDENRRREPRLRVSIPAGWASRDPIKIGAGILLNVTPNGALLRVPAAENLKIEKGASIYLGFTTPRGDVVEGLEACVVGVNHTCSVHSELMVELNLEFHQPPEAIRKILESAYSGTT